jgi:hypothetical protein
MSDRLATTRSTTRPGTGYRGDRAGAPLLTVVADVAPLVQMPRPRRDRDLVDHLEDGVADPEVLAAP